MFRIAIIIISLLLGGCSSPQTSQETVEQADALVANKEYNQAIIVYKNAIEQTPSFIEARFNLGLIYFSLGDHSSAEKYFLNAYDADYAKEKVVLLLAATYLQQNAMTALKHLLDTYSKPKIDSAFDLQLALYNVQYLGRKNQLKQAQKTLNDILLALPSLDRTCELCLLTTAHLQSYDAPTKAIDTIGKLLLAFPENAQAYLLRGQLYFALRNPSEAMNNFKRFQELQPKAGFVQLLIAVTAFQMKDTINATKYVDDLITANPNQALVNHLKALLVFEKQDYEAARVYAERSIDRGLKSPANYLMAGVSAYHQDKMEIAYKHLLKAVTFYPENNELQQLLMFIQFRFGYLEEASASYIKQDQRSVQNLLFGNLMAYRFIQDGQFDQAGSILDYLGNTPMSQPAIRLQTQALQNQLKLKEAIPLTELVTSTQDKPSEQKLLQIILLIQSNAILQAKDEAQKWLEQDSQNLDALNVLAYVYQQLKQSEEAEPLFKQALEINPLNTPSLFFFAEEALTQSNYQQAGLYYQTILQANPQNLSSLRSLLKLTFKHQGSPNWDQLFATLDLALISDDQIIALSDAMFQWQDYARLDRFLMEYKPQSQWSDLVWMVWLKNSFALSGADKFDSNFELYFKNNTLQDHVMFALSVLENQRQFELMLVLIERLPEPMQSTDAVQLQKAMVMLELEQYEQAGIVIGTLEKNQTVLAATSYIKGRTMEHEGDLAQAANYLSAYYEELPSFHSVNALANVLVKANRSEQLLLVANEYLENFPQDSTACLSLALKLAPSQPAFSLELLEREQLQWLINRNWKLSNNIAWLYFTQQAPEKAIKYSSNALLLNSGNNRVKLVHANILIALNREVEALFVLQEAKQPDSDIKSLIDKLVLAKQS